MIAFLWCLAAKVPDGTGRAGAAGHAGPEAATATSAMFAAVVQSQVQCSTHVDKLITMRAS